MKIHVIAAGTRPPPWIAQGFETYRSRLSAPMELVLKEIKTGAGPDDFARRVLGALPRRASVIALALEGEAWPTRELARQLQGWLGAGKDVALMIGGPDGLPEPCIERADRRWSLGPLTLPHMLVRVLIAEQLYRAYSLLNNHPYHRA